MRKFLFFCFIALALLSCSSSNDIIDDSIPADFVKIQSMNFPMGNLGAFSDTNSRTWLKEEFPLHNVYLNSYFICKHEVTQLEFSEICGFNPSIVKGDSLPVYLVTWYEAIDYCNKRSEKEGLEQCYTIQSDSSVICDFSKNGYRLPTEAEWELACKGTTATDYFTGNLREEDCTPLDESLDRAGWYCGNSDLAPSVVMKKQANEWGVFDMHGNVSEWCWDWYGSYSENSKENPKGADSGMQRVIRGGGFYNDALLCRSSFRGFRQYPNSNEGYMGFRVARTK